MESNTLHRGRLIDHILLVVEDFAASKNFYTAVLSALEIPAIATAKNTCWLTNWWWPHATARRPPGN